MCSIIEGKVSNKIDAPEGQEFVLVQSTYESNKQHFHNKENVEGKQMQQCIKLY